MKKLTALIIILSLCIMATSCVTKGDTNKTGEKGKEIIIEDNKQAQGGKDIATGENTICFIDSLGREVILPKNISKVAPADEEAQSVLFSIAPQKLAGWYKKLENNQKLSIKEEYQKLPLLTDKNMELNGDKLREINAEVILLMKGGEDMPDVDALSLKYGLPVIFVASDINTIATAYNTLGALFAMEDEVQEKAEYLKQAIDNLLKYQEQIKGDEKLNVYIGSGEDGVIPEKTQVFNLCPAFYAGADIGDEAVNEKTLAEAKIDAVIFKSEKAYKSVINGESLFNKADIEGINMGMYYMAPNALFNWIEARTTPDIIFGAKWLGNLLYPDIYQYDMAEEVRHHYDFFFNCQLDGDMAKELLKNSTLKVRG